MGIGVYIEKDKGFMRRRMLNNGSDGLVDQHTRFLMRFDNDFKVDGYPPPLISRMV